MDTGTSKATRDPSLYHATRPPEGAIPKVKLRRVKSASEGTKKADVDKGDSP